MLLDASKRPLMFIRPRNVDKLILEQALGLYQGFHVGATLPQFMTNFVRDLGKPFIVDPMIYIFTLRPTQLLDRKKGSIKPSIKSLAQQYGPLYQQTAGKQAITPANLLTNSNGIESITKNALKYQKSKFAGQLQFFNPYYEKYALWDDVEPPSPGISFSVPEVLLPPYFPFKKPSDPWYLVTLECSKSALSLKEQNDHIFPVLLLDPEVLENLDYIKQIISEFGSQEFDGFFLWINGFKEEDGKQEQLEGLLQLVKGLSSDSRSVFKLYGGYFSALLFAYGLKGFSCGLGYGSDKNIFKFGARGGKAAPRYYIPRLHRSIQFGDAERLLRSYPSLQCHCRVCEDVYGGGIDKFVEMQNGNRCAIHFLNVRKNELKEIEKKGLHQAFSEIEKTIREFDRDLLVNIESLKRWCKAIGGFRE